MYILVLIVLGLCLWYVSTMKEGVTNRTTSTSEGALLNEKMDAILALEDRITNLEQTLKSNSDQIKDVIMTQLPSIVK
jgi:hypothetical protein